MAMDKLGMEITKMGFQTADTSRSGSIVGGVSDDFRNLLQSKQEGTKESQKNQDKSQVSKDTKPEKKDSVSDDTKKDAVSNDQDKTEKPEEDSKKTDDLLASYQAIQGMRPQIIQIAPQAEAETPIPEAAETEIQVEGQMTAEIPAEVHEQAAQILAKDDKAPQNVETVKPSEHQEVNTLVKDEAVWAADSRPVTHAKASENKQQASDFTSQFKRTEKSVPVKEDNQAQAGNFAAEQAAAAASAEAPKTVHVEEKEYVPEYVSTIHVEQPEELPDKVADQLLAKLSEGVNEFEIHIEPANLGKIAVKILYEGSQAHVSIICSEKRAMDALGQNAREIGNMISKNFGGETTIIVEKQETDYLNQTRDENEHAKQEEQQKQKENGENQDGEDAEQFLQKLRLGLAG